MAQLTGVDVRSLSIIFFLLPKSILPKPNTIHTISSPLRPLFFLLKWPIVRREQMANAMERVGEAAQSVGQRVTDFFQGDPFGTLVGRKIELATDATKLATENWGLNMEICDFINGTNDGPRDAVRAIKKRLQTQMGKNNAIVMYTLTVLETCVKNCDQRFAVLVTNREFVGELVKMISTKHDAPQIVQERVLSIIQSWADAFRDDPPLSGVVELYDEFRAKGVEFPATNIDAMAPIITPKQTVFPSVIDQQQRGNAKVATQTFPLPSEQPLAQPQSQQQQQFVNNGSVELDLVQVNLTVLRELVAQMKPTNEGTETEAPDDFHFIRELYSTCKEMQKRVLELIPSVTNEEVIFELLSVNDELNSTFEKYDRCMTNYNAKGVDLSMVASGSGTKQHKDNGGAAGDELLIDLAEEGTEAKSIVDKMRQIDIQNDGGRGELSTAKGGGVAGMSNEAYVHDQAELPIRSVAYNKTDATTEKDGERAAELPKKKPGGVGKAFRNWSFSCQSVDKPPPPTFTPPTHFFL
uniref:Target of Myb protein 1 n=1 Tax=Globodera rostochiensis TaxID=31243 RepID=A0A914H062_GLORO